jgi:vibriolysin
VKRHLQTNTLAVATTLALIGFAASTASAAQRTDLNRADIAGIARENAAVAKAGLADTVHARHARSLGLDADSRLVLLARKESLGVRNHRYVQTFRGLPIFGEHVVVNEDASGNVRTLFGQKVAGLASEIPNRAVRLNQARALRIAQVAPVWAPMSVSCARRTRKRT